MQVNQNLHSDLRGMALPVPVVWKPLFRAVGIQLNPYASSVRYMVRRRLESFRRYPWCLMKPRKNSFKNDKYIMYF